MATITSVRIPDTLQTLIDSRLDTIDRMLVGRLPRSERLEIVREVESQIFELLQERSSDDTSREDVLAVLARLDPPEAYLPEESAGLEWVLSRRPPGSRPVRTARGGDPKVAKVSGILGLVAVASVLLIPLDYVVALALNSEVIFLVLGGGTFGLTLIGGILAIVLAVYSRMGSAWAVVGVVTGALSVLSCFTVPLIVVLLA